MESSDKILEFYPRLIGGQLTGLLDLFAGEPFLDDPRLGRIQGYQLFEQYVADSQDWLHAHQARPEIQHVTATPLRSVVECLLHLQLEGEAVALPVALVGDLAEGGLSFLRIYHSTWPLQKAHSLRPPIFDGCQDLELPEVVAAYQSALARGDLESILRQFDPEGYAREPSGGEYVYQGLDALRQFYQALFSGNGGIKLEHCTVTDDGVRCAIEYNAIQWGQTKLPPQAGVAVYERAPGGRLAAARIYDDVDPPISQS